MRPAVLAAALFLAAALLHPSAATRSLISIPAVGFHNTVVSLCSHTTDPDLCVKSIIENAPTLKSLDRDAILAVLLRAVGSKVREGKAFAIGLTKQYAPKSQTLELLRECVEAYDTVLGNLEDIRKARDVATRDSLINSMIPNVGTCEDGFDEFHIKSPMSAWTNTIKNMVANCLAIAT